MRPGPMHNGRLPRKPRGPAAEGQGTMPTEEPGDAVRRAVPKGRQAQGRGRSSHKVPRQMWPCSRVCVPVPTIRIKAACTAPTLRCGAGGGVGTAYPSAEKQGLTPGDLALLAFPATQSGRGPSRDVWLPSAHLVVRHLLPERGGGQGRRCRCLGEVGRGSWCPCPPRRGRPSPTASAPAQRQ